VKTVHLLFVLIRRLADTIVLTGRCILIPRAFDNRQTGRSWLHNDLDSYRRKLVTATLGSLPRVCSSPRRLPHYK
jgi:hypothetical protein